MQIDFIFHSTTSPWYHAPVDMFCRASGENLGQMSISEGWYSDFNIVVKAPVLFVQNKDAWNEVARLITGL